MSIKRKIRSNDFDEYRNLRQKRQKVSYVVGPSEDKVYVTIETFEKIVKIMQKQKPINLYERLKTLGPLTVKTNFSYTDQLQEITIPPPSLCGSHFLTNALYMLRKDHGSMQSDKHCAGRLVHSYANISHSPIQMLKNLFNVPTQRGTVKEVLQSGHSYLQSVLTYPLRNTFRGYILAGTTLQPNAIALPIQYVYKIFGNVVLKRDFESCRLNRIHRCNDYFEEYFDSTANFSLVMKRDPVIHAGSIQYVRRIYVSRNTDCIWVSPWTFGNFNMDVDGDTAVVMLISGVEAKIELEYKMNNAILFPCEPRYTFPQSMTLYAFALLCGRDTSDDFFEKHSPKEIEERLSWDVDVLRNKKARQRGIFLFTRRYFPFYEYVRRYYSNETIARSLNRMIVDINVALGADELFRFMNIVQRKIERESFDNCIFATDQPFSRGNWYVVYTGIKGSVRQLCDMQKSYVDTYDAPNLAKARNEKNATMERGDDGDGAVVVAAAAAAEFDDQQKSIFDDSNSFESCSKSDDCFVKNIPADHVDNMKAYLDNFVYKSNSVPIISYMTYMLNYVMQFGVLDNDQLLYNDEYLIQDLYEHIPLRLFFPVHLIYELFLSDKWLSEKNDRV